MNIRIERVLKEEAKPSGPQTETRSFINLPLELSEEPNRQWRDAFNKAVSKELDGGNCKVTLDKRIISLICSIQHTEFYLGKLRRICSTVNNEIVKTTAEQENRKEAIAKEEERQRDKIRKGLANVK